MRFIVPDMNTGVQIDDYSGFTAIHYGRTELTYQDV